MAYASAALFLAIMACNLPESAAPTPFVFPTPNLTLTEVYSDLGTATPAPPFVLTATAGSPAPQPTATSTIPALLQTFVPESPLPTNTLAPTDIQTAAPTQAGQLRPGPNIMAAYLANAPVIDGRLDEWSLEEHQVNHVVYGREEWVGENDLSGGVMVGWDESNIYFGARVRDDIYVQNSTGRLLYLGDSLEIQFDADLSGDFNVNILNRDDHQLGISPGLETPGNRPEAYLWNPPHKESARSDVQIEAQVVDGGYDIEVAVPWSIYGVTPQAGQSYGFAFNISDNDRPGEAVQQSFVSNVPTRRLLDPTTWGNLTLTR